jgi:orotidine-5'-phosphate decarboxylase
LIDKFSDRILESAKRHSSRIVLALDYVDGEPEQIQEKVQSIIEQTSGGLAAVKINLHLCLPLSLDQINQIVDIAHRHGLQVIADLKLNDIAATNLAVGKLIWNTGFDAVIANPIVGFEMGLGPLFEQAHAARRGVILLVYMSHRGATEGYGLTALDETGHRSTLYEIFLERAIKWGSDGIVVGATNPQIIAEVAKRVNGRISIYSPGVGEQGGSHIESVKAGTDFLIIGRSILRANDPLRLTERIRRDVWDLR